MLRKLQLLALVVRGADPAVETVRLLDQTLISEPPYHLPVFEDEWHLVTPHFQHGPATGIAALGEAEARVEKARVVDPELAHQWIDRDHFGSVARRYVQALLGSENVEFVWIEDQASVLARL